MTDDGLFADLRPTEPVGPTSATEGLAGWQVVQLREALDRAGVTAPDDRRSLVQELAGRPVAALGDLSVAEARVVLEGLVARKAPHAGAGGAWDDRDEDTWIDRL